MSQSITIPRGERGAIRVFAINRNPVEMEVALSRQPKPDLARELLDAPHLNTLGTEIFPIKDLEGVGLAGYLSEGYAVPDEQLSADRSKLDALDGYVLLLFSNSFGGQGGTLDPGPDVTLIGTYGETQPDNSASALAAESAAPYSGAGARPVPITNRRGNFLPIAILVMVALAVLWWVVT